jgi:hypothetical protein
MNGKENIECKLVINKDGALCLGRRRRSLRRVGATVKDFLTVQHEEAE